MGSIWKRAREKGGMWGMIKGFVIGLTRLGAKVFYTSVESANHSGLFLVFFDTTGCSSVADVFFCILV
jgi:SSS family solute:Na+ symporter